MADGADDENEQPVTYDVGGYRNAPGLSATPAGGTPSLPGPYDVPPGSITVDTENLSQASGRFSSLSDQVTQLYNTLTQALNGSAAGGSPWGNDPIGESFGQQYAPASQTTLQALQGLSQLFSSISSNLDQATQTYQAASDTINVIVKDL